MSKLLSKPISINSLGTKRASQVNYVLDVEGASIGHDVFLRYGLKAHGQINFWGAQIVGDFRLHEAEIVARTGSALNLRAASIGAEFVFGSDIRIVGDLDIRQAEARIFSDGPGASISGHIYLDGFTYVRLHDCPTSAEARIAWLRRQPTEHLDNSFRPQPWSQLIKVLKEMGHDEDARKIGVEREDLIAARSETTRLKRIWFRFLKFSVGYGYRPWRAIVASALFVTAGWVTFSVANELGYMTPRNGSVVALMAQYPSMGIPKGYTEFNGFIYALDVYLPVIELGQDEAWEVSTTRNKPAPHYIGTLGRGLAIQADFLFSAGLLRPIYWIEVLLGWIYVSLFIAGMSGIMKKD